MSETNRQTLATYEEFSHLYVEKTPHEVSDDQKVWIDTSLAGLKPDARILELGSAFGRDANYIESQGFSVARTDAAKSFVNILRADGQTAHEFNALTDEFDDSNYDLIFANRVLVHFSRPETEDVICKVHNALKDHGRFTFSTKQGDGEAWSNDKLGHARFYCYWQAPELEELLQTAGFRSSIASISYGDEKLLLVIAQKGGAA